MKLCNKITGEIREAEARDDGIYLYSVETEQWFKYDLPLLAGYWEYYDPKQPLIKNDNVRKLVKTWANINGINEVNYIILPDGLSVFANDEIEINFTFQVEGVQDDKRYTITELCGVEDE